MNSNVYFKRVYSFQNSLLEVTDKLRDSPVPTDSYSDAVDQLESLMHSLSNLFDNFGPKQNGGKQHGDDTADKTADGEVPAFPLGEPGKVLKIVAELNKLMGGTKETKI